MKLFITTGPNAVYISGSAITVPANQVDYEVANATLEDLEVLRGNALILELKLQYESSDSIAPMKAVVDEMADVTGGGTTVVAGFQLMDPSGTAKIAQEVLTNFGAFDDAGLGIVASHATLNTATAGSIVSGAGTNALKVKTSTAGKFTCTLTDASDETVYVGCGPTSGGSIVDCQSIENVTYSA